MKNCNKAFHSYNNDFNFINTFKAQQLTAIDLTNAFNAQHNLAQQISGMIDSFKIQPSVIQQLSTIDLTNAFNAQHNLAQQISDMIDSFKIQPSVIQQLSTINLTNAFNAQHNLAQQLSNVTSAFKIQPLVAQQLSTIDLTNAFKAQHNLAQQLGDMTSAFRVQSIMTQQLITNNLGTIIEKMNLGPFKDLHSAFDYLSEQYIINNEIEETDDKKEIINIANNLIEGKPLSEGLTPKQKEFIAVYLYPFILMILPVIISLLTSKPSIINNYTNIVNNPISIVNEYYTVQEGFSKDFLNNNSLRIISVNDAIIREKHDCSSKIISKLQIGKVVCITDKFKKWVKVSWSNESGEYKCGWIQNYKLTKFK